MTIKYHDNKHGVQYGEDHKLTNNWNAEANYKDNEYIDVHFRIETPSYYNSQYGVGFANDTDRANFFCEITKIFKALGWNIREENMFGSCPNVTHGKSHLYLHPQDISGEVKKNEVKSIAEALRQNKYFSMRWVDLYDDVYDITDNEYIEYLNTKKEEIKRLLLKSCKTTRTHLFVDCGVVAFNLADRVRLHRINDKDGYYAQRGFTANYINSVADELIEQGYLVLAKRTDVKLIRTINKTEQKKLKLFITEDMEAA